MRAIQVVCVVAVVVALSSAEAADVFNMPDGLTSLETVIVGNAGNVGEQSLIANGDTTYYGGVGYTYDIGKYEVTAGQYTEFLNAVAKTDTYGLYNFSMWSHTYGCKIQRSGSPGTYMYKVAPDRANRPVDFVSFWDACRFANWLHNGQGGGDTEKGAYTLTAAGIADNTVARNADWKWAVTSEDEWYKAAYHKNDGVTGNYYDYPTSSDATPSNDLVEPTDPGNNATFYDIYDSDYTIGSPYWRTEVGAHENSDSPYGTFDQGGNVWEWNDTDYGAGRGLRGGSYKAYDSHLLVSYRGYSYPTSEDYDWGFRVAAVFGAATLTWDGTDPAEWTSAHWNPGVVAPSGGEAMVVNSGTVTVSSDLTLTPAGSLVVTSGAVRIAPTGVLVVTNHVNVGTSGTLSIDGALACPAVTVSGGTLTSASGPGTGAIDGSLVLTDGATLAVEVTGAGMDSLNCTGTVTLDGASLNISTGFPGPALGTAMTLITADGGLDGTFGHVDGVLHGVNQAFAVTYQPNGATVTVARPGDVELDRDVDFSDFTYLAASYGQSGKSWVDGDCDGNGTVNFTDFTFLAANYGRDADSPPARAVDTPPAGTVELHVDVVTGEMQLVGNAATLSGYSITSAAGSLVPDGDGAAAPFQFYLSNLAGDISAASLGAGVLVDGELALDAEYDTSGPMDLTFSYGLDGQGGSLSGDVIVVPEPTCMALLGLGGLAVLRRRRR